MEVLKFTLSGQTAFFKKPDVNTYKYFTYGQIHKIALLGILGGILGLKGYSFQDKKDVFPEFYDKLQEIKIAIVPTNSENIRREQSNDKKENKEEITKGYTKGYINKKVQTFNNSVGYASKEKGGNLVVKEQWLENPIWNIYVLLDSSDILQELKERFLNMKFQYTPYLGKNDHCANIENVDILEVEEIEDFNKIDSLFLKDNFEIVFDEEDNTDFGKEDSEDKWKYEERLPVNLQKNTNQYITAPFCFTNMSVKTKSKITLYKADNKILFFF